jgi:subtilisin-like proprotein convertase family protein
MSKQKAHPQFRTSCTTASVKMGGSINFGLFLVDLVPRHDEGTLHHGIMNTKTAGKLGARLGKTLQPESDQARHAKWRKLAGLLLCLLALSGAVRSARAETITFSNTAALTTPDSGVASLFPSPIAIASAVGKITAVRVTLRNITHNFPDDYDILLVGPGGQRAILMSDCGGGSVLNNVTLTFSGAASGSLPDSAQIITGTYRPSNYGGATDAFPPAPAQSYSSSLTVFNNTSPVGTWNLYVVDDNSGNTGTIAGGWTLEMDTTAFGSTSSITIPDSGIGSPYPSQINVGGLPQAIRKMRVTLFLNHTFPDDVDLLLVGPGGQNAIIMSDAGGEAPAPNFVLAIDDAAVNSLPDNGPLVNGTFKPTNIGAGDAFPAPAPAPTGTSVLSVFDSVNPNGLWKLYVVDDSGGDNGSISQWILNFDLEPTVLANISTRMRVETGDNVLIGGFIVTGTQPKKVIVRAIGPSLPLAGKLSDPTLELRDANGALLRFNDDWRVGTGFPSQETEIIATGLAPTDNGESAIVATLPANGASYTAIVRGFNDATGIGVVEAYDLDRAVDSKLANISTRGLVQTGDNVMIAGTIVQGGLPQRVIVRALGPSLPLAGALADPTLELRDGNGALIASNDDWSDDQAADIIATIPPTNSRESAIVAILPTGGYTAIVRGLDGTTGVALVEVYALN